jgi:proteic killer suppression protein
MIRSFGDKQTERLFHRERVSTLPPELQQRALRKVRMLDAAQNLEDLRIPPGNRLEPLRGDREGQYSIRINDQFRICFEWRAGDAYQVELTDYH